MPNLDIQFIGTGTFVPEKERACSSTLLTFEDKQILVDIGTGSLRRLVEADINPLELDFLFITHFHPDHIGDLVNWLFVVALDENPHRIGPVLLGPVGLKQFLKAQALAYGDWLSHLLGRIEVRELETEKTAFSGWTVTRKYVQHTDNSLGFRFDFRGNTVAFSGDSGYCPALVELCRDADLAILECAYPDGRPTQNHLTPGDVIRIARQANPRQLAINHIYPDTRPGNPVAIIRAALDIPVEEVQDLQHLYLETFAKV
ncbi:MAG TPA: ribonuclease Z [Calditrichia bacterium]|nr:ribonuclease Z [Calditrichota bacterium]HQV34623.1 ribonuclease Z [Calditrichia bacterium]